MSGDIKNNVALTDSHNKLQREILTKMVQETLTLGGTMASVMVILESVTVGVLMAAQRLEGKPPEANLAALVDGVRDRLAGLKPSGRVN